MPSMASMPSSLFLKELGERLAELHEVKEEPLSTQDGGKVH